MSSPASSSTGSTRAGERGNVFRAGRGTRSRSRSSFNSSTHQRPVHLGAQMLFRDLRLIVEVRLPRPLAGAEALFHQPLLQPAVLLRKRVVRPDVHGLCGAPAGEFGQSNLVTSEPEPARER